MKTMDERIAEFLTDADKVTISKFPTTRYIRSRDDFIGYPSHSLKGHYVLMMELDADVIRRKPHIERLSRGFSSLAKRKAASKEQLAEIKAFEDDCLLLFELEKRFWHKLKENFAYHIAQNVIGDFTIELRKGWRVVICRRRKLVRNNKTIYLRK